MVGVISQDKMLKQLEKLRKIKRQKEKNGDFFVMDLTHISSHYQEPHTDSFSKCDNLYAYGRIIDCRPATGDIIEIFNYIGAFTDDADAVIATGRMFDPVNVAPQCFIRGRWKIIKSDEHFDKFNVGFEKIKLVMGGPMILELWEGGKTRPITEEEAIGLERFVTYFPINIEERILEIVKKRNMN